MKISLYDVYRLVVRIPFSKPRMLAEELEDDIWFSIGEEDRWQQLPAKIMLGNGFRDALMISINLKRDSNNRYLIQRLKYKMNF